MKLPRGMRIRREYTAAVLAVGLLVAFVPGKAAAKPRPSGGKDQRVCETAYQGAKEHVQNAQLLKAKELLEKCVTEACDAYLRQACTTLYTQLDRDVPSVVPLVTDDKGAPLALVEVRMDGALLTSKIDGLSVSIDPGKHEFSFSTDSGVFATRKVMILQGERNRTISVLLHSPQRKTHAAPTAVAVHNAPARKVASPAIAEAVAPKARHKNDPSSRRYE